MRKKRSSDHAVHRSSTFESGGWIKRAQEMGGWVACFVLLVSLIGCSPAADQQAETKPAQAELVLMEEQSVYPYLVFVNRGQADAQEVRVFSTKGGEELTAIGLSRDQQVTPAQKPITLAPGVGAHYQLLSKELREYTVKWSEDGQEHEQKMLLKAPGRIETH